MGILPVLEVITPITTYLLFVAPIPTLYEFYKRGSCGEASPFPYIMGFVCSFFLGHYGHVTGVATIVTVNIVGIIFSIVYLVFFYIYSPKKQQFTKQIVAMLVVSFSVVFYIDFIVHKFIGKDSAANQLGTICAATNVLTMGAPLVELQEVVHQKSTANLPFPLILVGFICGLEWFFYGMLIGDPFVMFPNGLGAALGLIQLLLFVIYPAKKIRTE